VAVALCGVVMAGARARRTAGPERAVARLVAGFAVVMAAFLGLAAASGRVL
jgi:hypothetical protein